jgi:hypothetical protein
VTRDVEAEADEEEATVLLWGHLYSDPLWELRLLALSSGLDTDAFDVALPYDSVTLALVEAARTSPLVRERAAVAGIDAQLFMDACIAVTESDPYARAAETRSHEWYFCATAARAIVAEAIRSTDQHAPVALDASLRDDLVNIVASATGTTLRSDSPVAAIAPAVINFVLSTRIVDNWLLQPKRLDASAYVLPRIGDILFYQTRGDEIREYIRSTVAQIDSLEPVVLLGHSLGGVACVDVLAQQPKDPRLERVQLLVTVGSQAGLFFGLDSLHSIRYGNSLPSGFPRWLNFFDPIDVLSYLAKPMFTSDLITDQRIDCCQPFPRAHSAYWFRPELWGRLLEDLDAYCRPE